MRPKVPDDLRQAVEGLVESAPSQFTHWVNQYGERRLASFAPDVFRFDYQSKILSQRRIPQLAAQFRDDGPDGEMLPVVVLAPDLHNVARSYQGFTETLRETKFLLEEVSPETARKIFEDRLAEFIAVRMAWTANNALSTLTQTIVTSNRSGETVICCQGYFTSTAAGFGTSNPAVGILSPGRYSFGIMNNGVHDFEGILWTCPSTTVRLRKP
jgi:hypothetical protein